MSSEIQTRFVVADTFVAKRRIVGGQKRIHIPAVFRERGFKEIRFAAILKEGRRWAGDVVAAFEDLTETSPFQMTRISAPSMTGRKKIQGVENLAQALHSLRLAGADSIEVTVAKPRFQPGSSQFGSSFQSICISAQIKDTNIIYEAMSIIEFPTNISGKLLFPPRTVGERIARWWVLR